MDSTIQEMLPNILHSINFNVQTQVFLLYYYFVYLHVHIVHMCRYTCHGMSIESREFVVFSFHLLL